MGPLELANALAACVLSARLSSKHRQWAAEQLVQALAATGRDGPSRPQTYSDLAGDLRKCSLKRLEGHYNKVGRVRCYVYNPIQNLLFCNFCNLLERKLCYIREANRGHKCRK